MTWTSTSESQGRIWPRQSRGLGGSWDGRGKERAHFAVPPPPEQGPMHDPRLDANICKGLEVRLHQVGEVALPLGVIELVVAEAAIVVGVEYRLIYTAHRQSAHSPAQQASPRTVPKNTRLHPASAGARFTGSQKKKRVPRTEIFVLGVPAFPTHILMLLGPDAQEIRIALPDGPGADTKAAKRQRQGQPAEAHRCTQHVSRSKER